MFKFLKKKPLNKVLIVNLVLLILAISVLLAFQFLVGYGKIFIIGTGSLFILNLFFSLLYCSIKETKWLKVLQKLMYAVTVISIFLLFDMFVFARQFTILIKSDEYQFEKIIHHTPTDKGNRFEIGRNNEGEYLGFVVNRNEVVTVEVSKDFENWSEKSGD